MSLFKTREWWRTVCGANETFDRHSLLVAALFGEERKDVVVVGSHDGYLRMYTPSSQWVEETKCSTNYKSTDSMIETRIGDCIVDLKAGRFVSGSQDLRLAVLTSSKLLVYNATLVDESTEYGLPLQHAGDRSTLLHPDRSSRMTSPGDRCDLKIVYEHSLPRFPASLTTGPFGGVRGRDFLCVQCLDGTLLFYEQEVFAFSQVLRNRLLPEPIIYISRNDLFVTGGSSWFLECYRYQSMAESARTKKSSEDDDEEEHRPVASATTATLEPDWSYNIGEAVLDIQAVTLSSFEVGIVVLGEKHLSCLKDSCTMVKYAKRLEYRPLCFRAYVIEPDGKLMVLVIADTSTLMIYEGTTLRWSAQLPFAPVAVARAHLQHLEGSIVVLSDDGLLEACYLGSEPGMFVAPPLHPRGYDYAAAEQQLGELRALLRKSKASGDRSSDATVDAELIVSVNVSPDLESSRRPLDRGSEEDVEGQQFACKVAIELSSYATLRDVQIVVDVCKPLILAENFYAIPNLCDRHVAETTVYVDGDLPPISSEVRVVVSYRTDQGSLRAIERMSQLPAKMMLRSCPPENATTFTTILKRSEPLVGFTQLFPEFIGDQAQRQNGNALGIRHAQNGRVVTIVSGNASNRYRVQSNDGLATTLVVQQLISRLKDRSTGSLSATIGQNHLQLLNSRIEAHFLARREIDRITSEIRLLTIQLRNIQRKMLRVIRERNSRSLSDTGLPFLFDCTYRDTFARLEELVRARTERDRTGHELWCSVRLLLLLLRLNAKEEKYAALEAAIGFEPRACDQLDWEEIADVAVTSLLRFVSRKPGTSEKPLTWSTITPIASSKELGKLKKRLAHVVERIDDSRGSNIAEVEPNDDLGSA